MTAAPRKISLTLEQAKEICGDFRVRDGKCMHLQPNKEMCNLPRYFQCELVRHKRAILRREEIVGTARSASRLATLETCARKYALHYIHKILSPEDAPWMRMGNAFGVARARIDVGMDVDETMLRKDLLPIERAKVCAAIRFYRNAILKTLDVGGFPYEQGSVTCEKEVLFEHRGVWFLGFADAVANDQKTIFEWKYAAGDYPLITIARQAAVYFKGVPEAERFVLCVMKKQGHRPRKAETVAQFEPRVYSMMQDDPCDWMRFTVIHRVGLDVDSVLDEMLDSFQREAPLMMLGAPPSYSMCDDCSYTSICEKNIGKTTDQIALSIKVG